MAKSTNGLGTGRSGTKDRVINSGQRQTMGTSVYTQPVDAPSGRDFISGMLEAKPGFAKDGAPVGLREPGGKGRAKVRANSGARYTISPNMYARPGFEQQNVQSNGRVIRSAVGTRRNFAG